MKAQRRHDLRTNTLAESMADAVEYLKEKGQIIVLVVSAVVVVLGVSWYWNYSATVRQQQGWQAMLALLNAPSVDQSAQLDQLQRVAESYRDPALRAMAWSQLGSRLLDAAASTSGPATTEQADNYIAGAKAAFETVIQETPNQTVPAAIAYLGLAAIAADRGDFETAMGYYEQVAGGEQFNNTPFQNQAAESLTLLERLGSLPALATAREPAAQQAAATQPSEG